MYRFILKRNSLFLLGIIAGLIAGPSADALAFLNLPVLMIIMTVSFSQLDIRSMLSIRSISGPLLAAVFLNMIFPGLIVMFAGYIMFGATSMWPGVVLAAVSPAGIGIVPFSIVLGGDVMFSAITVSCSFLVSMGTIPLIVDMFIGAGAVPSSEVADVLAKLILIPLILSRFLQSKNVKTKLKDYAGLITNSGFSIIFVVIFGINRDVFFYDPAEIVKLLLLFSVSVFIYAFLLKQVLIKLDLPERIFRSLMLIGPIKNSLFGAAIGMTLIGPAAALPGTVLTFVIIAYLFFIEKFMKH